MVSTEKRIDILKVIAHPARIKILEELTEGVKCVSDFEDSLDISQSNVSQHLTLLRTNGLVDFFVDGRLKCYFLREPFIPDLLELLKKQIYRGYSRTGLLDAWQMHLLRASDGSHYVAFSMEALADVGPDDSLALYVRLEPTPATPPSTVQPPRSAVEDWLRGERSDPLPIRARRVVTVPSGELPMGGTAATMTRDGSGQNSAVIALMERQLQKQREQDAAREKARREELEGKTKAQMDVMPFEDFDLHARVLPRHGRPPVFRRALTAGPGDYDVVVSWAVLDAKNRPTRTGGLRHPLTLPPVQTAGLALGSVILADAIHARTQHARRG